MTFGCLWTEIVPRMNSGEHYGAYAEDRTNQDNVSGCAHVESDQVFTTRRNPHPVHRSEESLLVKFPPNHSTRQLWREVRFVEPYPSGVVSVPEQIAGTSFFPGGSGVWCEGRSEVPPVPVGGIMILGHDFHSVAGYEWARANLAENLKSPTWRHLLTLLKDVPIPLDECFFTNVYMGLREGTHTTGRFPGSRDRAFVERCRIFFNRQLRLQRPRVILCLGGFVPAFLAPLSRGLAEWTPGHSFGELDKRSVAVVLNARFHGADHTCPVVALTHPCLRAVNVPRRRWQKNTGHSAELLMIRTALRPFP